MSNPILITGASGSLGGAAVQQFLQAGFTVRQGVRNLQKARPGADAVRLDFTQSETFAPALAGAAGLLLIAPSLDANAPAQLAPFIASAKTAGVGHIVFISALGANLDETTPLRLVEHSVTNSGIPYTILRPNFFMENFSTGYLSNSILAQNAIYLAAGEAKTSFISVRDVLAVAIAAFQKPLAGAEFDLTGPGPLDHAQAAALIAEASGRPVAYHALTEAQMSAGARAAGLPEPAVQYLAMLYQVVRAGYVAHVTGDVERVLGRPPVTFAEFAASNASVWK
jgi:uncharacterized protein YbjT (DUF2867 family)